MGTKNNPGKYDCYVKAEPDEPLFTIIARDPMASATVRGWAINRQNQLDMGLIVGQDEQIKAREQVQEAYACALAMENWRIEYLKRAEVAGQAKTP